MKIDFLGVYVYQLRATYSIREAVSPENQVIYIDVQRHWSLQRGRVLDVCSVSFLSPSLVPRNMYEVTTGLCNCIRQKREKDSEFKKSEEHWSHTEKTKDTL